MQDRMSSLCQDFFLSHQGISADSKAVYDSFQESVRQGHKRFEELYSQNESLFPTLRTQMDEAFSFLVGKVDYLISLPNPVVVLHSKEESDLLVRIVLLDMKKAMLDYAIMYMESCVWKQSLLEHETDDYRPELQEYTPPGNGKKTRPNLPAQAKDILSSWFRHHVEHPYPTQSEKVELSERTGLTLQKVDNWFINERSRKWQLYRRK